MKTITSREFVSKVRQSIILDVRSADEYAYKHLPGSQLIPTDELDLRSGEISRDKPVYVICQSGTRSRQACQKLNALGFENLISVEGGLAALEKEGAPVIKGSRVLPLMRQVQISAGLLVLTGLILSQLVHPAFVWLSAFVGAGLTFAGLTGYCGMALLLAKLPWNNGASCKPQMK